MLAEERQQWIRNRILKEGRVYVTQLAAELGVTDETIRRDIRVLAQDKSVHKTHGGAILNPAFERDNPLSVRIQQHSEEKKRIGQFTASLIEDGDVVYMPAIGSCLQAVMHLREVRNVMLVTPSLDIASIISSKIEEGVITGSLFMLGGQVVTKHNSTAGVVMAGMLRGFHFSKIFLGANAVSEEGPLLYSPDLCEINKTLIHQAETVFLLAESAKFSKDSLYWYAGFSDIDVFITDDISPVPADVDHAIKRNQVRLYRVGADGHPV